MAYFEALTAPSVVIIAEQTPPSSKAEMETMAALSQVQAVRLPGTLGLAEEYGDGG